MINKAEKSQPLGFQSLVPSNTSFKMPAFSVVGSEDLSWFLLPLLPLLLWVV